jgi:hypothetical protein
MDVLKALGQTLAKMFAADLWLSLGAVAVVAACGLALTARLLPPAAIPYLLLAGVLAALALGILRAAARR